MDLAALGMDLVALGMDLAVLGMDLAVLGMAVGPGMGLGLGRATAEAAVVWGGCLLGVPSAASAEVCLVMSWARSPENARGVARTATTPARIRGKIRAGSPNPTRVRGAQTGGTVAVAKISLAATSAVAVAPTSRRTAGR